MRIICIIDDVLCKLFFFVIDDVFSEDSPMMIKQRELSD
jgi:hypothetical protein